MKVVFRHDKFSIQSRWDTKFKIAMLDVSLIVVEAISLENFTSNS